MSNTKKAGRRERLLARQRPTLDYQLAVEDDSAAMAELAAAKEALDVARFRTDDTAEQAVTDAQKRLETARAAVAACYEPVHLTALPPTEFEALAAKPEHLPREDKKEAWNDETFPRAVFLACVDTSDLSAAEWEEFVDSQLTVAERSSLFIAALGLNARWPDGAIPKD